MALIEFTADQGSKSSLTVSKSVSAGSTVIAWLSVETTNAWTPSTGTLIDNSTHSGTGRNVIAYKSENVSAGTFTFTITEDSTTARSAILRAVEITGAASSGAVEAFDKNNGIGTSGVQAGATGISASSGATLLALWCWDRATTLTSSGYTLATQLTQGGGPCVSDYSYKVAGSALSGQTASGTVSPNAFYAAILLSVKAAAAAPVLSSPTGTATGNTTASGAATTTGTDGTLYAVRSAAQPTNAQIVAGQDSTGAASSAGSLAITSAGAKTIPLTGVAVPTGSQTVWFLHRPAAGAASDSNVVSAAWTQPTPATLSSPTNTPGSTTALVGCTTNTTSGTLYALARVGGSAASASTIVATGQTATVSTTTPSKTYTGLTASTSNYYVDMVQTSGVTTSNVVTTGPFTTSASGDTTPPTLTGSIVIGTVSSTTIQMSWPAGSDNVAVTSYEVSKDSGTNWTDVGNVLTYTFTGLTASTSYGLRVRAKDAAGNVSTPALAATQSTSAAGGVGSINLNNAALYVFKKNNATTIASTSVTFWVSDVTTGTLVGSAITGLSTNASGLVTTAISNASMVAGTTYRLNYEFSSGEYGCVKLPAV